MEKTLEFKLVRPALKSGGDRYEHGKKGDDHWITLYIPQYISRAEGMPYSSLAVTIKA